MPPSVQLTYQTQNARGQDEVHFDLGGIFLVGFVMMASVELGMHSADGVAALVSALICRK